MNHQNKTYKQNHAKIREALHLALKNRYLCLRAQDVCRAARITPTTFYSHCRTVNAALYDYEQELQTEFVHSVSNSLKRSRTFTLLLMFIYRHRAYFKATLNSQNYYLLNKIILDNRESFLYIEINPRTLFHYISEVIHLITSWCHFDNLASHKIPIYVNRLVHIQVNYEREDTPVSLHDKTKNS